MRAKEFITDGKAQFSEDRHPNAKPYGPESPPEMPKGTIKVDVSDVYDWYKLGMHLSDLEGLGKHDFGQGPPQTILSFGSEELEHMYLDALEKLGLTTHDIDPGTHPGSKKEPQYGYKVESLVAEGRIQYKEIEFVCANPDFCDATDPVKQQQLYKALTKIPGVIALYQDQSEYSEGQMSLSAIFKDPQARKQILQTAKKFGVAVDLEQSVDDNYVDRAIRGEHYGQIQGVAEGSEQISIKVRKGHNKFATELSVDGKTAGVYQYDTNSGRSIAEVYPEYRGKGVGKILVLHAIYTAAKLGMDFIEDESRTAEYDNVLDSLDSNGLAVNDDGYWYVTGEGEQYLKQRLKQGVAEGLDYEREPLYHATLKAFEPSIMKSGLLPGGNLRMFDWSNSKFVYLSNYPDIARDFIDPGVIEPDEEHEEQIFDLMKQGGVILKIDQNKLNRQLLSADPHFNTDADDGAETYIYSGVIPPSAIIGKQYFNINESKQGVAEGASGYIPSKKQANDPRFKTALTVDVKPDTIKKNAKAFGFKVSRAGIPPLLREGLLNETGYEEAAELLGQPIPEIQKFVQSQNWPAPIDWNNPEHDKFARKLGSIIDAAPDTQIPAASIPKLKNLASKNDEPILKAVTQISGRPDAEEQYVKLMQTRDKGENRNRGYSVNDLIKSVKTGTYDSPVLLKLPEGVFVIGGRTRLYAALALNIPAKVKIISAETFNGSKVTEGKNTGKITAYHGTRRDIDKFKPFSHFGTFRAAYDRLDHTRRGEKNEIDNEQIYQVELNITNPIKLDVDIYNNHKLSDWVDLMQRVKVISSDEAQSIRSPGDLLKLLLSKGYDSILYKNRWEHPGSTSYVVLKPEQINVTDTITHNDTSKMRKLMKR